MRQMKTKMIMSAAAFLMAAFTLQAQPADNYTQSDDKTMVTRYYDDGSVREQGTYLGKKLDGQWMEFFRNGKLKTQAYFENGQKEGTWYVWTEDGEHLYEVKYEDNTLIDSHKWKIAERNLVATE